MSEIVRIITDQGLAIMLAITLLYFIVKHGDKFLETLHKRLQEKNLVVDSLTETVKSCTRAIDANTKAFEQNSQVIKNYTDNAHKLEDEIAVLRDAVKEASFKLDNIYRERGK